MISSSYREDLQKFYTNFNLTESEHKITIIIAAASIFLVFNTC